MIGQCPQFLKTVRLIEKISRCDVPVLIEGETGTGKELAARAIHYNSVRRDHPFVPVNCGAIPDALFENELFGHQQGAYTDARQAQVGLIANANGGTLFLDEVDTLTPKAQVTLLRFLQDQQYRPLGSQSACLADVRMIAASNVNLCDLTEAGAFRSDLLFRLKIMYLVLPPLRETR
jgi:transcriptional regulator with PAS, ATPase and Fis domain